MATQHSKHEQRHALPLESSRFQIRHDHAPDADAAKRSREMLMGSLIPNDGRIVGDAGGETENDGDAQRSCTHRNRHDDINSRSHARVAP